MQTTHSAAAPVPSRDTSFSLRGPGVLGLRGPFRLALAAGVLVGAVVAWSGTDPAAAYRTEPDLVRLLRATALIKGVFLLAACAVLDWRLRRPVSVPLGTAYVLAASVSAAAVMALWRLDQLGLSAIVLHGTAVALVLLAWRDADFLPAHWRGRPGCSGPNTRV